jgi:hypothetical protein
MRAIALTAALWVLVAACVPSAQPILKTRSEATMGTPCLGIDLGELKLWADPEAPPGSQVWVTSERTDGEFLPVWPFGYIGRFDGGLQVFDREGDLVVREGGLFSAGGRFEGDEVVISEINGDCVL